LLGSLLDGRVCLPRLSAERRPDRLDLREGLGEHPNQDRAVGVGGEAEEDHPGVVEVFRPVQPTGSAGLAPILTAATKPTHDDERISIADYRRQ